jgi:HNH endonuclease
MEKWKLIPSLPSHLASSDGMVMVIPFVGKMPHGGPKHYGGSPTKGVLREGRYCLFYKGKNYKVHRLVCEAFNGPPPENAVCMHLDENALNNKPENLRWGTQKENLAAPGFRAYLKRRGFQKSTLTAQDAAFIKYGFGSCVDVAKEFNISPATVSNIRAGRTWRHV